MSTAAPTFDPYREWLGIEPHEQPADFYRLIGIAPFEADLVRIAMAADQRMALVRSFQTGPRGMHTQRLLNELSAARIALLSPESKAAYDAALSRHLAARIAPTPMPQHAAYAGSGVSPAVLTFGLGQTPVVPAPPVLPPPPPAAPRVALQFERQEDEPAPEEVRPVPWWRPLAVAVGVPVLLLAAVIGWAVGKPYFDASFGNPVTVPTEGAAGENEQPQPPPEPPPPKAIVLLQEGSGEVVFSPATAALSGAVELQVAGTGEVLTSWTGPGDSAEWRFKLVKPGFFQAEVVYAMTAEAAGTPLELTIGERTNAIELRSSGGLEQFLTDTKPVLVATSGEQTLTIRPAAQHPGNWLILRSVRLIPPDRKPAEPEPPAKP
jgi:hypothetical protein